MLALNEPLDGKFGFHELINPFIGFWALKKKLHIQCESVIMGMFGLDYFNFFL